MQIAWKMPRKMISREAGVAQVFYGSESEPAWDSKELSVVLDPFVDEGAIPPAQLGKIGMNPPPPQYCVQAPLAYAPAP